MTNDPYMAIVKAHRHTNTARNYTEDAMAELQTFEQPSVEQKAEEKRKSVEISIKNAERELERAKKELGIDE